MKQEFDIQDTWLPYEIHPKLPQEGMAWNQYFNSMDSAAFMSQLDVRGKELGVRFNHQPLMSNTRRALMGGEFAKEHGRYHEYHDAIFEAYFTDCRDIGDMGVLMDVADSVGLDRDAFGQAVLRDTYLHRLDETTKNAKNNWVTAAPTFDIEGYGKLTGAQPAETFRAAFAEVLKGKQ